MEGELAVLKNALSEAEAKRVFYAGKDIQTAMDRCNKLESLVVNRESPSWRKICFFFQE